MATFVAELRHVAIHRDYKKALNDMLWDRLICGVNNSRIQQRLLLETEIDFKKALEID